MPTQMREAASTAQRKRRTGGYEIRPCKPFGPSEMAGRVPFVCPLGHLPRLSRQPRGPLPRARLVPVPVQDSRRSASASRGGFTGYYYNAPEAQARHARPVGRQHRSGCIVQYSALLIRVEIDPPHCRIQRQCETRHGGASDDLSFLVCCGAEILQTCNLHRYGTAARQC
jgi:hypothetical protein